MKTALQTLLASALVTACGGSIARAGDVDRIGVTPGAQEGSDLAPEIGAQAKHEQVEAQSAHAAGREIEAALHTERAEASYLHALAVARHVRATAELEQAQTALASTTAQTKELETAYDELRRKAEELEQRVREGKKHASPGSGPAQDGADAAARVVMARSLGEQGRLLCDAAKMIAADAAGLPEAEVQLGKVTERLAKNGAAVSIDEAADARQRCLDALTRARRALGGDSGGADALLTELGAAGGWSPARDERGVVITVRAAFRGSDLTRSASATLIELGRVAAAHPAFALQVVVHDAQPPGPDDTADAKRAAATVEALVAGGAVPSRVKAELAGARVPLLDPRGGSAIARNERMDVVFVSSGR
jgi:hypothetical protein